NITTNGIRTVHWDIVRHGNICGGEPVMGKAIKSVWKYRGQSRLFLVTVHTETKEHVASFLTLDRYQKVNII
ncbi:hypothetical protein N8Z01_19300, partial [Enterobacter hormaechei subsp. hoffmannii]|nr:hypothetical protein [Enterobacter hormaechei subsp. hoffmannii]MCU3684632.1 hypothetical protein [Enterobacter hormaechei subsp. hoffmannii]MCU3699014.1 hypothetical protein [Enterobacter hormaechei subsp. hoffmannii]